MKVLVADKFPESGITKMQSLDCEVVYDPELKEQALVEALRTTGADVVVVRSTKITEPMLAASRLSLVIRAGAGYDTIDVGAASARGIYVSNCPGKNSIAVAELAFGLILALDRRIADNVIELRQGKWNKKEYSKARGLYGRKLGIIGMGQIGREVASRARAFGMPVVGWSRSLTFDRAYDLRVEYKESPEEVAASCDILTVHLALTPETKGRIGETVFAAMRPGSYFINTSRAAIVDQAALERAVREKGIRAGLDVFAKEPSSTAGAFEDPIAQLPNVYGTHHIGASTDQAQDAIAEETVRILHVYKETGQVPNVVNLCRHSPATYMLVVRHRDRVGVLADVLNALKAAGINIQEMENIVFEGAEAAVARIHLSGAPSKDRLKQIQDANADIYDLSVLSLQD